jgi:hypothetical protein
MQHFKQHPSINLQSSEIAPPPPPHLQLLQFRISGFQRENNVKRSLQGRSYVVQSNICTQTGTMTLRPDCDPCPQPGEIIFTYLAFLYEDDMLLVNDILVVELDIFVVGIICIYLHFQYMNCTYRYCIY